MAKKKMIFIISPAKTMEEETSLFVGETMPIFLEEANMLWKELSAMSLSKMQQVWKCSKALAEKNYQQMSLGRLPKEGRTPALMAYQGLQYQAMAPKVFSKGELEYVKEHLRILSGLYGILRPMDVVIPYRLEMQAQLDTVSVKSLYAFWGEKIFSALSKDASVIINLASKEYSKVILPFAKGKIPVITCTFGTRVGDAVKQKATFAKMARGEMVRFAAEKGVSNPEELKTFCGERYLYCEELSTETEYFFTDN